MAASEEVPFFGLDREFKAHETEFLEVTRRSLAHGKVLQGPEVADFERELALRCRRQHAVAVGSCTDALAFALLAHGVGPGDVVLVTGFSFFASVSCILRVGATPRFVDIEEGTCMMDLGRLEAAVCPRTRALVAVHLYGQCLPMPRVEAFAKKHGLVLVEDAAQAIGARFEGRPAGNLGHVSCLSFDPTKVVGCFGSAGAAVTDDAGLAARLRMLRYHGRDPASGKFEVLGYNSQLPSAQAAQFLLKLARFDERQARRDRIAALYLDRLSGIPDLVLPSVRPGSTHNWHKFVVRTERRDHLKQQLQKAGIASLVHYGEPLSHQPAVRAAAVAPSPLPVAEAVSRTVLSLPIFPELTDAEVERVASAARRALDVAVRS